jgi:hypothetical protein
MEKSVATPITQKIMPRSFPKSTAISEISDITNDTVKITWKAGNSYTYHIEDVADYSRLLDEVVASNASIGSFVNSQIQQKNLSLVNS